MFKVSVSVIFAALDNKAASLQTDPHRADGGHGCGEGEGGGGGGHQEGEGDQVWVDGGRPLEMPPQHLGHDALPEADLGGGPSWHMDGMYG